MFVPRAKEDTKLSHSVVIEFRYVALQMAHFMI
jgi:hypothetical protein